MKAESEAVYSKADVRMAAGEGTHSPTGHIGTPIGEPLNLEGDPKLEGIAFSDENRELFVLSDMKNDMDGDGHPETGEQIQIYAYDPESSTLLLESSFTVPKADDTGEYFCNGRGLAFRKERGKRVLYTLSSQADGTKDEDGKDNFISRLWRIDFTRPESIRARTLDLDQDAFDMRCAEVFDLTCDKRGGIYISLDASKGAADLNTQRARGIFTFRDGGGWHDGGWGAEQESGSSIRMLPANGKTPDHHNLGLTMLEMDGHEYLIGTVEELTSTENQEIYVAEAETGRGLFRFDAPPLTGTCRTERRLAYGAGVLWVGEQRAGPDQVRRVLIKDNVYTPLTGYKRPRRIQITITSEALGPDGRDGGYIIHNFGHPLRNDIKPSQEGYFEGHSLRFEFPDSQASGGSSPPACSVKNFSYAPLNDPSSSGCVTQVRYSTAVTGPGLYKTVFQEDFWTREYRNFVYPHLAGNSLGILENTDFRLGHLKKGDPDIIDSLTRFHWTRQERIFEDFVARVKTYIVDKYGVEADLTNPYWAARNILEYIRDNYNYPDPVASEDGSGDSRGNVVDYDHFHVANGPAVYKMIMTDPRFNKDIHIRRSGCMAAGGVFLAVMRYLGFPARWMGTSQQKKTRDDRPGANGVFYDLNGDGMFNGDDYMEASHGHYTNEVYLGPGYGWQRFDVSPKKPDDREGDGLDYDDYGYLHSRDSQYELMRDKVGTSGHQPHAVSSSIGVGYNEHFFAHSTENSPDCDQKSIFHEATGVYTSACKGGGSYDFVSIYEHPGKVVTRFDLDPRMRWRPCLMFDVEVNQGRPVVGENKIEFTPQGPWALFEPDALVEIVLRIEDGDGITHRVLKSGIPWDKGGETFIIPEGLSGRPLHIQVRKIGVEKFIGGASRKFRLK